MRIVSSHLKAAKSFFRRQAALAALRAVRRARRVQRSTCCTRTAKAVSRVGEPSPIHSKECERRLFTPRAVTAVRQLLTAPKALRALLQRRSCSTAHVRHATRTASDESAPRALSESKSVRTVISHLETAKSFFRRQAALAALRAAKRARRVQRSTHCTRTVKAVSRVGEPSPIHSKECERRLFTPRAVNTVRRLLTAPRALRAVQTAPSVQRSTRATRHSHGV